MEAITPIWRRHLPLCTGNAEMYAVNPPAPQLTFSALHLAARVFCHFPGLLSAICLLHLQQHISISLPTLGAAGWKLSGRTGLPDKAGGLGVVKNKIQFHLDQIKNKINSTTVILEAWRARLRSVENTPQLTFSSCNPARCLPLKKMTAQG